MVRSLRSLGSRKAYEEVVADAIEKTFDPLPGKNSFARLP
jgi:hypothetical protein